MIFKKKHLYQLLIFIGVLAVILIATFGPIDQSPLQEQAFYISMMHKLDTLSPNSYPTSKPLKTGWAKVNITPDQKTPMAGYKPRSQFTSVHDSLYANILLIDNGKVTIPIISVDLMLFPPVLKKKLTQSMPSYVDQIYLGATHTHNSIGGWDNSFAGQFIVGDYNSKLIDDLANKILQGIQSAKANMQVTGMNYFKSNAHQYVENRLANADGTTDGWLRGVHIKRQDHTSAVLTSYGAHPTTITSQSLALSGDYPAMLNNTLTHHHQYDFAMFMAGMVGSHSLTGIDGANFNKIANAGKTLGALVPKNTNSFKPDTIPVTFFEVEVEHGPAQLRISKYLKIRNWIFELLMGPLQGKITVFQIGDIVFIGTSGDFSGELYKAEIAEYAQQLNLHPIITSFNGHYTGYIIHDKHYLNSLKEEATTMNWVGPHYGQYYIEMIRKILFKLPHSKN